MLYIIVPYRDRKHNLDQFLDVLPKYLAKQDIQFQIFIIGQDNDGIFNRGLLKNIGFDYVYQNYPQDGAYYAFHDVDILPNGSLLSYHDPGNYIVHRYGYDFCLGCMFLTNADNFIIANGFPNDYWGYGMEDCTLQMRFLHHHIEINRTIFKERNTSDQVIELEHHRPDDDIVSDEKNKILWEQEKNDPTLAKINGLLSLQYRVNDVIELTKNIFLVKIDFDLSIDH